MRPDIHGNQQPDHRPHCQPTMALFDAVGFRKHLINKGGGKHTGKDIDGQLAGELVIGRKLPYGKGHRDLRG
ncbi:hypothetical protein [Herpetosiphon geysericola]|uniref:hypothetical protein n=1 Tax=Herpetosiphon geysericola TaxID=70996 RepID=UPI001F383A5F|nr:hypothetical protein [Herpetosiphon geysericola]